MNKVLSVLLILTIALTSVGCAKTKEVAKPWFTYPSGVVEATAFRVYPVKVIIGNVPPKSLIDTWVSDGKLEQCPDYCWKKGEPITINIHNVYGYPADFELTYESTYSETIDKESGITYQPAPSVAENWVILSTNRITIPAGAIAHIPMEIRIPAKLPQMFDRWEFRITIDDRSQIGQLVTNVSVRYLISMRQ